MPVACDRRDQDLLFLTHGLLGARRRILTRAHLRGCAACRDRLRFFDAASDDLRFAFEGPPKRTPQPVPRRGKLLVVALAILLLAAVVGAYVYLLREEPIVYPQCDALASLQRAGDTYAASPEDEADGSTLRSEAWADARAPISALIRLAKSYVEIKREPPHEA